MANAAMDLLVDAATVAAGLERIAGEILARDRDHARLGLVGIRRGGEPVARELGRLLEQRLGHSVPIGSVDITLYRDDAATALPSPRIGPSHVPFPVGAARVILVDDVLYSGRTIRAALDALLDYGRPRRIELLVVADRGGRELPIQPDYLVAATPVDDDSRVEVLHDDRGFRVVRAPAGQRSDEAAS
jgi:pyrimidine operon attenuation protein/uracil phosphoribosyltransferase